MLRSMNRPAESSADAASAAMKLGDHESTESISRDGVDLSLIRRMLSLTPLERLEYLQGFVDSVVALRNGKWA